MPTFMLPVIRCPRCNTEVASSAFVLDRVFYCMSAFKWLPKYDPSKTYQCPNRKCGVMISPAKRDATWDAIPPLALDRDGNILPGQIREPPVTDFDELIRRATRPKD